MWLSSADIKYKTAKVRWFYISALVFALCCMTFLTSGCGFAPLYATGPNNNYSLTPFFADIEVAPINNREGQMLRNLLIDRIYTQGRPAGARYELRVKQPRETISRLGIRKDATATRAQMEVSTEMHLVDRFSGETVIKRELRSFNGYNILDSQFTTMITEENARERALNDISDQIVTQLGLYFQREANKG